MVRVTIFCLFCSALACCPAVPTTRSDWLPALYSGARPVQQRSPAYHRADTRWLSRPPGLMELSDHTLYIHMMSPESDFSTQLYVPSSITYRTSAPKITGINVTNFTYKYWGNPRHFWLFFWSQISIKSLWNTCGLRCVLWCVRNN